MCSFYMAGTFFFFNFLKFIYISWRLLYNIASTFLTTGPPGNSWPACPLVCISLGSDTWRDSSQLESGKQSILYVTIRWNSIDG